MTIEKRLEELEAEIEAAASRNDQVEFAKAYGLYADLVQLAIRTGYDVEVPA